MILKWIDRAFYDAFRDCTDETKYDVEYRMRLADGSYQWFRDKGEVSRCADGTAFHMVGIFVNIDKEKKQRSTLGEQMLFTAHTRKPTSVNIMWILKKTVLIP